MRKAWMIAALVLLALSVSGCANADYSEGTPSSEASLLLLMQTRVNYQGSSQYKYGMEDKPNDKK